VRLIIVRHGRTERTDKGIVEGQLDGGLSKVGREETEELAKRLRYLKIDVMYVSDLQRSVETAEIIARYHDGVDMELRDRLRERNYGAHQGRHWSMAWSADTRIENRTAPGGETFEELRNRVKGFIDEIRALHLNDTVLVATHRCPIVAILSLLLNIDSEKAARMVPPYSGIITLEVGEVGARVVENPKGF